MSEMWQHILNSKINIKGKCFYISDAEKVGPVKCNTNIHTSVSLTLCCFFSSKIRVKWCSSIFHTITSSSWELSESTWQMNPVEVHCRTQRLNFLFFLFLISLSVQVVMKIGSSSINGSCRTLKKKGQTVLLHTSSVSFYITMPQKQKVTTYTRLSVCDCVWCNFTVKREKESKILRSLLYCVYSTLWEKKIHTVLSTVVLCLRSVLPCQFHLFLLLLLLL